VAPNLITFSSLVILSLAHILYMSGDHSHGVAAWRLVLMAVCLFIYQNLDNLDGKQARRTSNPHFYSDSSSPLGMLFDHGTDAVASFLISLQVVEFLQLQDPFERVVLVFVFVMMVYFSAMWAQYSTGYFRLGRINPVDEGLPGYAIAALANIFLPEGFWNYENAIGKYNHCLLYILGVFLFLIIYYMVRDNFKNAVRSESDIKKALLLPVSYAVMLVLLKLFRPEVY
jgi:ethanolaminephosphotransferase